MSVLVIAAHPDDEVLGAGGTIALYANKGIPVHIQILGEGITSRSPEHTSDHAQDLLKLRQDAGKASLTLGATSCRLESLPDNRFDSIPLLNIIKLVEIEIDRLRPDVVYTHHSADLNIDHRLTFQAVLTATRPVLGTSVKRLLSFEVPSSTEWSFGQFDPMFRPTTFVDIAETLEVKLRSMRCYQSEERDFPHPRSLEALKIIAQRWGTVVGFKAAEAFQLIRSLHPEGSEI